MDTARQILRFSIPGSIFLLHTVACYLVFRSIQGVPFAEASASLRDNISGAIAVLAAIPVGFVIYQIYYFNYAPVIGFWPKGWNGRFVRKDRGGQILKNLEADQLATLESIFNRPIQIEPAHCVVPDGESLLQKLMHRTGVLEIAGPQKDLPMTDKARQLAYEDLWYTHWDLLRSAVDIAGSHPDSEQVKTEYTNLSDIYHSLGAARSAVLLAWTSVFVLAVVHFGHSLSEIAASIGGLFVITAASAALYVVLHTARGRTWRSAEASLSMGLRWLHWQRGDELTKRRTDA
jgi:hypothetical protein